MRKNIKFRLPGLLSLFLAVLLIFSNLPMISMTLADTGGEDPAQENPPSAMQQEVFHNVSVLFDADKGTVEINEQIYDPEIGPIQVEAGTDVAVKITPRGGYEILSVKFAGIDQPIENSELFEGIIENISADTDIEVQYDVKAYTLAFSVDGEGTLKDEKGEPIISDGGQVRQVRHGGDFSFIAEPAEEFYVQSIRIDSSEVDLENDESLEKLENGYKYTFKNVTSDHTVEVSFMKELFITVEETENGEAFVDKTTVKHGGEAVLTMIPDPDYKVKTVFINNSEIPVEDNPDFDEDEDGNLIYKITNITEDLTIRVVFEEIDDLDGAWKEFVSLDREPLVPAYIKDGKEIYLFSNDNVKMSPNDPYNRLRINQGRWQREYTFNQSTGIHRIDVRRHIFSHSRVPLENDIFILIDTEAPVVGAPENMDDKWHQGEITVTGNINNKEQNFNGISYASDIEGVYYKPGSFSKDEGLAADYNSDTGKYSFVIPDEEYNGIYSIWAVDEAGNISNPLEINVKVDKTPPSLINGKEAVIFEQENDGKLSKFLNFLTFGTFFNKQIKVKVQAEDDGSGVEEINLETSDDATVPELVPGSFQRDGNRVKAEFTLDVDEFEGSFRVKLNDEAGNEQMVPVTKANSNIEADNSGIVMVEKIDPSAGISVVAEDKNFGGDHEYNGDVIFNISASDQESGVNMVVVTVNEKEIIRELYHEQEEKQVQPEIDSINTAELVADEDGSYHVLLEVVDNAGNVSTAEVTTYKDTAAPEIESLIFSSANEKQELTKENFHDFLELEDYGYYFKEELTVTVRAADVSEPGQHASGVKAVVIYLKDHANGSYYEVLADGGLEEIEESEIDKIEPIETEGEFSFVAPENLKGQIFVKAIDQVGNESEYVTPDGTIIETPEQHTQEEHISFAKPETEFKDKNDLDLYAENVDVELTVTDTYSGIKEIEWSVEAPNDSENNQSGRVVIDNGGEFTAGSDKAGWEKTGTEQNLVTEMKKTITVSNNSNDIVLKVKLKDRAGNISEEELKFSIDKTAPSIEVTFDNNSPDPNHQDIYDQDRTATVVIKERNFDPNDVKFHITNASGSVPEPSNWETVPNENNPDESTHTATIHFSEDGHYTFDVDYADLAENAAPDVPMHEFIIDKTVPEIKVTYDNNSAANGKYYNKDRIATIEITEHNFDPERVEIIGSATLDGNEENPVAFPSLSGWTSKGDVHTATIHYSRDGHYRFDITFTDKAGNKAPDYEEDKFVIDKTVPVLDLDDGDAVTFEQTNDHYFARILNFLTFGTFFNKEIKVTVKTRDVTSGIEEIELLTSDEDVVPELVKGSFKQDGLKAEAEFILDVEEFEGTIEAGIRDLAKNYNTILADNKNSNIEADNNGVIMIEKNAPTAEITVIPQDGTSSDGGNQYNGDVTYEISVEDADSGVNTAVVDVNGTKFEYDYSGEKEKVTKPAPYRITTDHPDIQINEDGSYIVSVYVIDNAGNPFEDNIVTYKDLTAPRITGFIFSTAENGRYEVIDEAKEMRDTLELMEYGYFFKKPVRVTIHADDPEAEYEFTSGVKAMAVYLKDHDNGKYYAVVKDGSLKEIKESEIESIEAIDSDGEIYFDIPGNFKGQIFAKAVDRVQNTSGYQTPNGAIIETPKQHAKEKHIAFEKTETEFKDPNGLDLYNKNVDVKLTVTDTYSGISEIEWSVAAPHDKENNQSGKLKIKNDKTYAAGSDTEGWKQTKTEYNLVTEMTKTIPVRNNSNNIVLKVKMKDRAGNASEEEIRFSIDKTAPTIEYSYDNNSPDPENAAFYNADRTAVIVITERNFNPEDVKYLITNTDGGVPSLQGWRTVRNAENPDQTTHTAQIRYTEDGDYTFDISYTDLAGNRAPAVQKDSFTIDKTDPVVEVAYNNNAAFNGHYFNRDRTATITVTEHNFDSSRVRITGTAEDNGNPIDFPSLSGWSSNGDVHTATIHFAADGEYSFDIDFADMAGNVMADYNPDQFIIDQTAPELAITGVEDRSANNGDVIPIITYSDTNFDENAVSIELSGANRGAVEVNGSYLELQNGQVFTFNNFEKIKENDDLYTLTATLADLAGNQTSESITFSVNRFGSVYVFDEALRELNGKFVQQEMDVIVTEINVDSLERETINVKITKNGTPRDLLEGPDYTVAETGGDGQWSQYTYTIKKDHFSGDGRYTVALYSEDAAGNVNENIDETKEAEISFGVDKTAPVIVPIDIEDEKQYAVDKKPVTVSITDNLVLAEASVYLNDEMIEYQVDGDNYSFTVPSKNSPQNIRVVAADAAGNEVAAEIKDVLVSTNFFVRLYNNTGLFIGSIAGVGSVAAGLVSYFAVKRRKAKVDVNEDRAAEA